MTTREILFDGNPPWGFRMNGGADVGHQLRISRVNPGSKAEAKGVREGDLITSINGHSTKCLSNSDSHALLRTVKENLRLGLNEDQNGSPRRRSKEMKSSPAVTEKEATPAANKENAKPSRSKLRRQRKQKLKALLKEKLLGFKETPGNVLTDGPVPDDSQGGSSCASDEAELGGSVPKDDDDSSRKLYDNVARDDNGREPCFDTIISPSETTGSDSPSCPASSFIQVEKVAVTVERIGPREETDCQKNPLSNLSERTHCYPEPGKSEGPHEISKPSKTVLVAPQKAQVHVWVDKTSSKVPKIEEGVVENNPTSESAGVKKAVEVVMCSPETETISSETGVFLVQHPDEVQVEFKKYLSANDLSDVLSSTTTDEEENVYELIPSDVYTPVIAHADELRLRSYLGTMGLHEPYDITTEEARVCPPTEIPAYFLPPKRYLDVISEENSDLSDGDRPWENSERIRQANLIIDTIPEDWFGSQDGIDNSWRDGKSLEDMSDIPVVTDSHSDSETLAEDSQKSYEQGAKKPSNAETNPPSSQNVKKNVVYSFYSSKQTLQPIKIETVKNVGTIEGPNSEVVEIVYLDSSDSEAISSSKSDTNLNTTINQESSGFSTCPRIVDVVNQPTLPSANTEVVEIVCIDTSDSEVVSCKSESAISTPVPPFEKEPAQPRDSVCLENFNVPKSNEFIFVPNGSKTNASMQKQNKPPDESLKREETQISEMISDITQSANEIISTSNEHLARMTPCTSPSTRKSRRTNVTVEAKLNLKERCSSLPLLDKGSCEAFKSTRSVCSDMGEDNEFPHFITYTESDTSSQSTTKPFQLGVTPLKELSLSAVLRLPFGISFLKQLGFDQSEYDSYSGYMPEGSEYSFSSKQPLSEREYVLADDSENDNESISGSLPPRSMPGESLPNSPPPPTRRDSGKLTGVHVPKDTKLLKAVSPVQSKTSKCSQPNVVDLLDLHQKFVERRGYHESDEKFPAAKYDLHVSKKEEDGIEDFAEFRALQEYHALRQQRMRDAKKVGKKEKSAGEDKKRVDPAKSSNEKEIDLFDEKDISESPARIDVTVTSAAEKEDVGKVGDGVDRSADEGSKGNQVVDNSRLLELIQREEFKGSSEEVNMTATTSYPYWILLEKQTGSSGEDTKGASPEANETIEMGKEPSEDVPGKITMSPITRSRRDKYHNNLLGVQEEGQDPKERPKSVPPSGDKFRQMMYEEYMNKLAELSQRRRLKAIKLSEPSKSVSTSSLPTVDHLPREFMDRVKERMLKLGLTDEFVLVDNSLMAEMEDQKPPSEEGKKLPKHVRELMDMADELGVWSPAQTPETERKQLDFSTAENRGDRKEKEAKSEEPAPVVWTPRSAGPSPTLGRKFRPVNFQSPPPQRKEYSSKDIKPELPKDLPPETSSSTTSTSLNSSSRLISSTSESSTLTSTQLRLPSSQNPTITLLQKAREGQIPKGAQYLEDTAPDRPSAIAPDEIIYSVKKEYTSADEEGVKKVVELTPKKFAGIGPTTRDGVPIGLRSEVNENNQQRWYKRMYDSLHKTADHDSQYPYSSYAGGYVSEPERLGGYDSDASVSKYATLDRRKIRNKENDFTTSTLPRNRYAPAVKHAVNVYKNQPGRIEDYEPGHSSIAEVEKKQWWDEVLDIFDGELNSSSKDLYATPSRQSFTNYALKDAGYDSDSTLVFKRRENMSEDLSPAEQKMAYKVVQRGGEVPLHGLRKSMPDRPKEPIGNPIPTPPRDHASRLHRQESPHRYVESEVNIHYKSPIRAEAKAAWPEDELAEKQAEIMRRIYQEQRRTKYLNELHDMYSRRHTDNLLPSQKSPIPLNRYDDFPLELQPPRPRDRTPEPKLVARALYNFVGQTSRELSFRRGDIIYVRRQIDKNWYEGEHNAMIGLFPFNYVEIIPYDGIRTLPKKANEGQARAKFNFQAQTHLELSLVKGELVLLTRRVDENWFEGRIGNRKGIFPVSYVEVLVEPGERNLSPSGPISTKPVNAPASHSVMLNGAKDIGQQHYQPPRPALYSSSSLPPQSKMSDIGMVSQSLHIDTQSDPVPYRVLYNYKPQNDDELELKEGDVVYVMEKCDDGWYVGSLHRNGQFGTFPGNYVERIMQ